MKLWYQSLARQTESTPYGEMLIRVINAACDPGTTVHLQGMRESAGIGRFTAKCGGYAAPAGEFLERVRQFYGPDVYPGAK